VVSDLASLFGCCFGFQDAATAITVVALGTSLPDLFASQTSAKNDEWADASIVNVTGSNSVNVFLGIGLPWTMASAYWRQVGATDEWKARFAGAQADIYPNGAFVVSSEGLGFSVTIFSAAAVITLCVLRARRIAFQGELGGPWGAKLASSVVLVLLWASYVGLSMWRLESDSASVVTIPMIIITVLAVIATIALEIVLRSAGHPAEPEKPPGRTTLRPSGRLSVAPRTSVDVRDIMSIESPVKGDQPAQIGLASELRLVQEAEAASRISRSRQSDSTQGEGHTSRVVPQANPQPPTKKAAEEKRLKPLQKKTVRPTSQTE